MIGKAEQIYRSLGLRSLVDIVGAALLTRASGVGAKLLKPMGIAPKSWARRILTRQSADVPSKELFDHWLKLLLESQMPLEIWVPSYLGKAFSHLVPFVGSGTKVVPYQDLKTRGTQPDWVLINRSMLGLLAHELMPHLASLGVNFENATFILLKKALPGEATLESSRADLCGEVRRLASLGSGETEISVHGLRYRVRPQTMDPAILNEVRDEYFPWLEAHGRRFGIVLDIGAQIGGFSTQVTQLLEAGGRIHSFEPEPKNIALLHANVALNGFGDRIEVHAAAMSDRVGKATLYVSSDNTGGNKLGSPEASSRESVDVPTIDVLEFVRGLPGRIDLVKIDVEGWELPILRRLKPELGRVDAVIGELQLSEIGGTDESLSILKEAGFEVETKGDSAQLVFFARRT